jgi:hypothetical protein
MGFQRFDSGTDVTLLAKSRFVLLADALCNQATSSTLGLTVVFWVDSKFEECHWYALMC